MSYYPTLRLGIEMNWGDDLNLLVTIKDTSGNPVNLTGYTFWGDMKRDTNPDTEIEASFDFSIMNQTENPGQVQWSLPNQITREIEVSTATAQRKRRLTTPYVFDVMMESAAGQVVRLIEGIIYVSPNVSGAAP